MAKLITKDLLNSISEQAKNSVRLRMNYNFHETADAPIQRMLNALEPNTYLPPHRHSDKDEIYIIIRGNLITVFFDEKGNITDKIILNPAIGNYGLEISAGTWHSIVVLEPDSVIYEIKQGPYLSSSEKDIAPWAPLASDQKAVEMFMQKVLRA